jgi:hypothetical protein
MSIQNILSYFFEQQNKETPNTVSNLLDQITGDGNTNLNTKKIIGLKAIETPEVDNSVMMKQYLEDLKKVPQRQQTKPITILPFYSSETPI